MLSNSEKCHIFIFECQLIAGKAEGSKQMWKDETFSVKWQAVGIRQGNIKLLSLGKV